MSQTRTHLLERRKREEQVGELRNMARHKQGLTRWRGGRGRSRLVRLETWHVTNQDSLPGGEGEGGCGKWGQQRGASQMMTHLRKGRRTADSNSDLRDVEHHQRGVTH